MARSRKRKPMNEEELGILIVAGLCLYAKYKHYIDISWVLVGSATGVLLLVCLLLFLKDWKYRKVKANDIDRMSGEQFEDLLHYYLRKTGWKVKKTPKTGDFGADLVGTAPNGVTYVIQAKRWKSRVRIEAVQQVIGARSYYKATAALVITNNYLTKSAWELARRANVEVWDRKKLEAVIKAAQKQKNQEKQQARPQSGKGMSM